MTFHKGQRVTVKTSEELTESRYNGVTVTSSMNKYFGKEFIISEVDDDFTCVLKTIGNNKVVDLDGDTIWWGFDMLKTSIIKHKQVGEFITFKKDLHLNNKYGSLIYTNQVYDFITSNDRSCKISDVDTSDNTFKVDGSSLWFSYEMVADNGQVNENTNVPHLEIGDIAIIREDLDSSIVYDEVGINLRMVDMGGQVVSITNVKDDNQLKIDYDNGRYTWTPSMFSNVKQYDWIFDINKFLINDIVIKCKTQNDLNIFINKFSAMGFKWASNRELDANIDVKERNCFYGLMDENGKLVLTFCDEGWFVNNGFIIYNFNRIYIGNKNKTTLEECNVNSSFTTKYSLTKRKIQMGDIYYIQHEYLDSQTGWRLAMNGYSVGLNTEDIKSWSSLEQDINLKITKIIFNNRVLQSFSNVSEFIRTCNEELVENIITIVK